MKKNLSAAIIVACILFFLPSKNYAQYLNLGYVENCTLFTVNGAVTNTVPSTFKGNIGADVGDLTGFESTSTSYTVHQNDAFTNQAKIDVLNAYILLNNVPVTNTVHAAAFTGTITHGVYLIGGAGSITGTVYLDGENDTNAVFIFKFQGAFTPETASQIVLINKTRAANVFWIAEGAIATGTGCKIVGTLIAHPGAVTIGNGGTLEGRMLSTTGAINFGSGDAKLPNSTSTIPIDCVTTCDNTILGTAAGFALFTSFGAISNTGTSGVIGDVGTNAGGALTGYDITTKTILIGNAQYQNTVTQKAADDLQTAYTTLSGRTVITPHSAVYGTTAGEELAPGVYANDGAGSIQGTLTLNGGGDINAEFIFKIGAGFTIAGQSRVILINGARRCNIFWIAEGAVSIGALSFMKGNVIAHNGAISMAAQGFLEGRMFTTQGACTFDKSTTYISNSLCEGSMNNNSTARVLPIKLLSFTAECYNQNITLKWATATEAYNKNFSVERSNDGKIWELVGNITGAGNSGSLINYSLGDNLASKNTTVFYRLKQTDTDNNFTYSKIIFVEKCGVKEEDNLSFSPNPSSGQINFNFSGDKSQVSFTEIFNVQGEKVYQSNGFQSKIDLNNQAAGIYLIRVHLNSKTIVRKIVVSK